MGPGALETALALYQTPSLAAATRLRPVPRDVFEVIRIAAGDAEATEAAVALSGGSRAVVREASQLYLEHVLFDPDADHYRVLGVAADAEVAQMGEHRRWLLKWLHPDRADDWDAVYAARVQQAWHQLRDPERRTAYDDSLADHDDWSPAAAGPALRPVWTARALGAGEGPPPRSGVVNWAAGGGIAALLLALGWLLWPSAGPPTPARADLEPIAAPQAESDPVQMHVLEHVPLSDPADAAQTPVPAAMASAASPGTPTRSADIIPAPSGTPLAAARPLPTPHTDVEPAAVVPGSAPEHAPEPAPSRAPASADAGPLAGAAPAGAPREASPATHRSAPAHFDADAVERVLLAFRAAYERGDIDALMAVFTEDAVNRRGGREAIQQDYLHLFRSTRQRRLQWHSLTWQATPEHALGEGGFVASITPRRGAPNTVRGRVRVEVVERQGQVRIRELWHEDQAP